MNNNNNNNQNFASNTRYATFGERFAAVIKDWAHMWWLAIVGFILGQFPIAMLILNNSGNNKFISMLISILPLAWPLLFIIFVQPIYAMFADASNKHATKGKLQKNICVLNGEEDFLTLGESALRMLLKYITFLVPFGLVATIITICCTKKKQALHDLILKHTVVKMNGNYNNQGGQIVEYNTQTGEPIYTNQDMPIQIKKSILPYISLILFVIFILFNRNGILEIIQAMFKADFENLTTLILVLFVFNLPILFTISAVGAAALQKYFQKKIILNRFWLYVCWFTTLFTIIPCLLLVLTIFIGIILEIIKII